MANETNDELDAGGEYPPREVLEQWSVPEMPSDMKERVMRADAQMDAQGGRLEGGWWRAPGDARGAVRRLQASRWTTPIAIAGFAAAAAALVIALQRPTPPSPAPAPTGATPAVAVVASPTNEPRGHLTLDVTPIDARVEIDGVPLDGAPPYVATNLPPGRHVVSVSRDGYVSWSRAIDVPAGQLHLPIGLVDAERAEAEVRKPKSSAKLASEASLGIRGSGLDRDVIRRVVRLHIDEVTSCYNAALEADPDISGRIVLEMTIGSDGHVPRVVIAESDVPEELGACIAKAAKTWVFPAPADGGDVLVTYPFVLETGD